MLLFVVMGYNSWSIRGEDDAAGCVVVQHSVLLENDVLNLFLNMKKF